MIFLKINPFRGVQTVLFSPNLVFHRKAIRFIHQIGFSDTQNVPKEDKTNLVQATKPKNKVIISSRYSFSLGD